MNYQTESTVSLIRVLEPLPEPTAGERSAATDFTTTAQEAFDALQTTSGGTDLLARFPELKDVPAGREIAYFSQCEIRGTAEVPQFINEDGIAQCRVRFDVPVDAGIKGLISCFFRSPFGPANYTMTAKLDNGQQATVAIKVDGETKRTLTVSGPATVPQPAVLPLGPHSFEIEQMSGSFEFLSVTVHGAVPEGSGIVPYVRNMPSTVAGTHVHQAGLVSAWTGDPISSNTYVVSQSPRPGQVIALGSTVTMRLREGRTP